MQEACSTQYIVFVGLKMHRYTRVDIWNLKCNNRMSHYINGGSLMSIPFSVPFIKLESNLLMTNNEPH